MWRFYKYWKLLAVRAVEGGPEVATTLYRRTFVPTVFAIYSRGFYPEYETLPGFTRQENVEHI